MSWFADRGIRDDPLSDDSNSCGKPHREFAFWFVSCVFSCSLSDSPAAVEGDGVELCDALPPSDVPGVGEGVDSIVSPGQERSVDGDQA